MNLPHIHSMDINNDEGVFHLIVSPQLEAFQGHFPGHPILAGVVQLDWAMHFAATYLGTGQRVAQNFKVKFHRIIRPDMPLVLNLRLDRTKGSLVFSYSCAEHIMSRGQITLEAPL